jgi:hypothetical protein
LTRVRAYQGEAGVWYTRSPDAVMLPLMAQPAGGAGRLATWVVAARARQSQAASASPCQMPRPAARAAASAST